MVRNSRLQRREPAKRAQRSVKTIEALLNGGSIYQALIPSSCRLLLLLLLPRGSGESFADQRRIISVNLTGGPVARRGTVGSRHRVKPAKAWEARVVREGGEVGRGTPVGLRDGAGPQRSPLELYHNDPLRSPNRKTLH